MSTKYSISPRERWRLESDDRPRFTDHSIDRHNERTPNWSSSPETAYLQGVDLSEIVGLFTDNGGQTPDKAVFFAEKRGVFDWYGVVLLIRDRHVVTVYALSGLDAPLKAYLETLAHSEGLV